MIEEFEYSGVWWLPSDRDRRIPGRLRFSQREGATLELDGSFTDDPEIKEMFNPAVVNGVSSNGVEITLHRCIGREWRSYHPADTYTSTLYAHEVFEGVHFERHEDISFKYLSVSYSHLNEWLGVSGFDIRRENDGISIKYKTPDSIPVFISSDLVLFIVFLTSYSPFALTKVDVNQQARIMIAPAQEKSFDEYRDIVHRIQDFLTLANMEPVYPSFIQGETESKREIVGGQVFYPKIKIFYQLAFSPQAPGRFEPLFAYKAISDKFESLLQNWFGKAKQLEPVYELYFGSIYNPHMYLQQRFLCVAQALESYHRRTMQNYELPEDKHSRRITEILEAVPTKYKKWLTRKLKYSYEPDLQRRLRELLDSQSAGISEFIGDRKSFIDKVVTTRNYLVHYDPGLEAKVAKGKELHDITRRLKLIVEVCLLKELGFSSNEVEVLLPAKYRDIRAKPPEGADWS